MRFTFIPVALFMLIGASTSASTAADVSPIRLTNYTDGTQIRYPVPLIRGALADESLTEVTVVNTSSKRPTREVKGLAHQGRFKVLTELLPGTNKLVIKAGDAELPLTLIYKQQTNNYLVRVVYATDNSGATDYQSPDTNDPQNYAGKIDTAMKLMQTLTAERLHDLGYGRRTFNLELDTNGKVVVHPHKGKQPAQVYYDLTEQGWYDAIKEEMRGQLRDFTVKNVVVAAYTRYDPQAGRAKGHTALGGGSLALFGSGNLFTWPGSLHEVHRAFMNDARIDGRNFMDDSSGRGTYWGAASTSMGATLHELSHTFGLPHTNEHRDIMSRGFDYFSRVFVLQEAASNKRPGRLLDFAPAAEAHFAPISAAALCASPWFQSDRPRVHLRDRIELAYDANEEAFTASSVRGVRYVGVMVNGDMHLFKAPPVDKPAPRRLTVTLDEIIQVINDEAFAVRIINGDGKVRDVPTDGLLP